MRRALSMALILFAGCASDQPRERKSFSERASSYVSHVIDDNIRGGKTEEEFQKDLAESNARHQAFLDSIGTDRPNAEKYGASY